MHIWSSRDLYIVQFDKHVWKKEIQCRMLLRFGAFKRAKKFKYTYKHGSTLTHTCYFTTYRRVFILTKTLPLCSINVPGSAYHYKQRCMFYYFQFHHDDSLYWCKQLPRTREKYHDHLRKFCIFWIRGWIGVCLGHRNRLHCKILVGCNHAF